MGFIAIVNVPGYSPMDDEPPTVFASASEAWGYLRDERERGEDDTEPPESGEDYADYSDTYHTLNVCSGNTSGSARVMWAELGFGADGQGTVYGPTPGYDGDHDLGLAYTVTYVDQDAPDI